MTNEYSLLRVLVISGSISVFSPKWADSKQMSQLDKISALFFCRFCTNFISEKETQAPSWLSSHLKKGERDVCKGPMAEHWLWSLASKPCSYEKRLSIQNLAIMRNVSQHPSLLLNMKFSCMFLHLQHENHSMS